MKIHSAEAIVLRHTDYGEADRIVTFLTPEYGFQRGFARAARKSRKRFGAALEPFARVCLQWTERSGDLVTLREAELIDLHAGLYADLGAIALAGYGCELIEALTGEQQGHEEGFELLLAFLDHLAAYGAAAESRLLLELRLLALAGYIPHLLHCSDCGAALGGEGQAAFDAERGGSLCTGCAPAGSPLQVSPLTLGSLARSLRVPGTRFAGFRFSPLTLSEGRAVLGNALRPHLLRPLRSLAFLESLETR